MLDTVHSAVVGCALIVLFGIVLIPILRVGFRDLRRQGLLFCLIAFGCLVSMATKPDTDPDSDDPVVTNTVTFVEGAHGVRTGGGDLVQEVVSGKSAVEPVITAETGWEFTGWDKAFNNVQSDLVVTAQYREESSDPPVYTVAFAIGSHGVRTGGGLLVQEVEEGSDATAPTVSADSGWIFLGWDVSFVNVQGDLTVTALYQESEPEPNTHTVTFYVGSHGVRTGGGELVQEVQDGADAKAPIITADSGWAFRGWDISFFNVHSDLSVEPLYEELTSGDDPVVPDDPDDPVDPDPASDVTSFHLAPDSDMAFDLSVANVYDGYAYDARGAVTATVQVKTEKGQKGIAKVTGTVVWAETGKKTSFKGGRVDATGVVSDMVAAGQTLSVRLGNIGMTGTLGACSVDGARSIFSARDTYAKTTAAYVRWRQAGNYNVVWREDAGVNILNVSVSANGKAKVSGTLLNGKKVSATATLSVGKNGHACGIPVLMTKGTASSFVIWLTDYGKSVSGLDDASVSAVTGLTEGPCVFGVDVQALGAAVENEQSDLARVLTEYLPDGMSVEQKGSKWIVDGGSKTGKVVVDKTTGEVDEAKSKTAGYNVSALKLTYTAKTGAFKGSFKIYVVTGNGKSYSVKSVTANVTGFVVESVGQGTASVKFGKTTQSFPVSIVPPQAAASRF